MRILARTLGTLAFGVALVAASSAAAPGFRDVLDVPAARSALAQRALLNGLAGAGNRIVAVGQRGHVLYSDDAGATWRQADVPVSSDLVAVSFPTATTGWAVGHDGVVLRSTDAGAKWTRMLDGRGVGAALVAHYTKHPDPVLAADPKRLGAMQEEAKRFAAQGADTPLLDAWFESETTGFVVGAFGLILRTADAGASWQPWLHAIDNPKSLHLYAIRAIGGEVYVAGEQGLLLKLDRAAGRFRALEVPYQGTLFGITGNARAVVVHGLRGTLLRSTDAGRSWQSVPTGLQVGLTGSTLDTEGRIVVVSQAGHVLVGNDDATSFRAARIERPLPAASVIAAGKDAVVVAGPRGLQVQPTR